MPKDRFRRGNNGFSKAKYGRGFQPTANFTHCQARCRQDMARASGTALQTHIDAQHAGTFDINCPACRELQHKQDAFLENVARGTSDDNREM